MGPCPLSNLESTTVPLANVSLFDFNSNNSDSIIIDDNKSPTPSPVLAEIGIA